MRFKIVITALLVYAQLTSVTCQSCFSEHLTLQTTLESPNYPGRYWPNLNCEYVIKSPYTCENEFNVNFMDFSLETSPDCANDKLIISYTGLDNQEDRDIICGSTIGLKIYKTIDGVLNIKFVTDARNQDLGFKISVTRSPCVEINEVTTYYAVYNPETTTIESNDINIVAETFVVETTEPPLDLDLIPPEATNTSEFDVRTLSVQPSSHYPPWNFYLPPQSVYPTRPVNNNYYPNNCCHNNNNRPQYPIYPSYPSYPTYPTTTPPYWNQQWPCHPQNPTNPPPIQPPTTYQPVVPPIWTTETTTQDPIIIIPVHYRQELPPRQIITPQFPVNCCRATTFNQNRFYLTNPGFPSNAQPNGDCIFIINKSSPNVCRLTIRFKYFLIIDQTNQCANNFIEIDGNRICGCRTGLVYESQWGTGDKVIRFRTTNDNSRPIKGFVLDVVQEECPNRYLGHAEKRQWNNNRPIANLEAYAPHTATVQTNSTSLATYYYYNRPPNNQGGSTNEIDEPLRAEQPRARFFYGTGFLNTRNLCSFGFLEWAVLSAQPLWTNRPICYAAQQQYIRN